MSAEAVAVTNKPTSALKVLLAKQVVNNTRSPADFVPTKEQPVGYLESTAHYVGESGFSFDLRHPNRVLV